jgi:hypothetical protein
MIPSHIYNQGENIFLTMLEDSILNNSKKF